MLKNPDPRRESIDLSYLHRSAQLRSLGLGVSLRQYVADFLQRLRSDSLKLYMPAPPDEWVARGEGHFHLEPQLFLQVTGWTRFRFPQSELLLQAGEALLVPPHLLHLEQVGADSDDAPFCNVVVYAEHGTISCHIAHEVGDGIPTVLYLEARQQGPSLRLRDWLSDAAKLGCAPAGNKLQHLLDAQAHALIAAVLTGVLCALEEEPVDSAEPLLVARVRVLVQSQLGDQQLSVRGLAEQSGCTADYLSHVFHHASSEHLISYINRQRIARASSLLSESDLSGKEIAWACGFASQSYFIRTFRTQMKMTPKAWRAHAKRTAIV